MKNHRLANIIVVRITGEGLERFLNICKSRNIRLRDIEYKVLKNEEGDSITNIPMLYAKLYASEFKHMREICKITRCRIKILKKTGPYFVINKYRNRLAFVIGIFISIILVFVCHLFVWDISFSGNIKNTDYTMLRYLRQKGVVIGTAMSLVDCEQLEKDIREDFDDINWVSVSVQGNSLRVHVKENDGYIIEDNEYLSGCDIVADKNGTIDSIITRSGTPLVKKGDEVSVGQVLVSGIVNILNDSKEVIGEQRVAADADIYINVSEEYNDTLDKKYEIKEFTGKIYKSKIICIAGKCFEFGLPVGKLGEYDTFTQIEFPSVDDEFYFPFTIGDKEKREYVIKEEEYTKDSAKEVLERRFNIYIQDLEQNKVQLTGNNVKMDENENFFCANGTISMKGQFIERQEINECD